MDDNAALTAKGSGSGYAVEIRKGELHVNNNKVKLAAERKAPAVNQEILGSGNIATEETQDPQMPYSTVYDGIDPLFSNSGMLGTADKIKITAPKLAKGQLKAGSASDQTFSVALTGAMPEVSVYVAAKDAKKLWPSLYTGSDNVLLTRANIAKYKIPFRVTDCDIKSGDIAGANNTLTLTFNGAEEFSPHCFSQEQQQQDEDGRGQNPQGQRQRSSRSCVVSGQHKAGNRRPRRPGQLRRNPRGDLLRQARNPRPLHNHSERRRQERSQHRRETAPV